MDLSLKAKCVEGAARQPYRQSGRSVSDALELTGQTVMNAVRWLGPVAHYKVPSGQEKKKIRYLFIEADEDHEVELLTKDVEVGEVYKGKVVRIMPFGAFIEILPGKDGLLHISKMANHRVEKVEDVMNIGDEVEVKVTEIDKQGRINLNRKDLL